MASDRNERQNQRDDSDETRIDSEDAATAESGDGDAPNPPRTTTRGGWTSPKFGSAGSGGAELEPGPKKN